MSNFLGRNKHKIKRDKHANADYSDYAENPEKLKQKFVEKSKASWGECEYLYSVRALGFQRRPGGVGGSAELDSVLGLFYLPEEARVAIVPFEFAPTVEVGSFRFLNDIHQINNDDNSADINILFGDSECIWRVANSSLRDDVVCILSQLSKNTTGLTLASTGQMPDMDFSEKGYEQKYPALFKLLDSTTPINSTQEDEKEAELLLEHLDWTKPVPALQSQLQDDILTLNVEICDLLLQWEDDEAIPQANGTVDNFSSSRIRDTVELLTTLNHVDKELGFVDDWLGNQIDHLSQVQAEIKQIENESGTLETSLQNLTSVKMLISSITHSLQMSRANEDVLVRAEKNLKNLLASGMSSSESDAVIDPLTSALDALKKAMSTNEHSLGHGSGGREYSRDDWNHLKIVSGIMEQRQKLNSIVFNYCSAVGDFMTNLFSGILRHKSLNDVSNASCVLVRRFSFSTAQFEVLVCSGRVPPSLSAPDRTVAMLQKNQMLSSQRCYHEAVMTFVPILEHTLALSPTLLYRVIKAYTEAAQQYLYGPLLRQLFKEMLPLTSSQSAISFASLPRTKPARATPAAGAGAYGTYHELGVLAGTNSLVGQTGKHPTTSSTSMLHIWDSVLIIIMITAPVVGREELFFQGLIPEAEALTGEPGQHSIPAIDEMFSVFRERVLRVASSTEQVNAVEILAMLVFFESMLRLNSLLSQSEESGTSLEDEIDVGVYTFPKSFIMPSFILSVISEAKDLLSDRLDQFMTDEICWLQAGKGGLSDAKMLGVFPAFAKFPSYLDVVEELAGGQSFPFVEKFLITVGSQLLNCLYSSAAANEKYHNAIVIQNLSFFEATINSRSTFNSYPVLAVLLEESTQKLFEAEKHYLDWMISYEMPSFSALSIKIDGVEKRANREELSIYIRRQDVIKVISGLSAKSVEGSLAVMRKRLDKHFGMASSLELALIPKMWEALEDRLHAMFVSMEDVVQASYQLSFSLRPDALFNLFDKHK